MALVMGAAVLTRDPVQSSPARAPGSEKARVRVLAHPWADVYVDGQLVDTTPVGHPLLLSPGRHEIVFRHPRASEQRRSIEVAPGEALTVEVEMPVVRPPPPPVDSSP